MAQSKKYDSKIQQNGATWTAKIIRRVTAQKTMVSKQQHGFASEAEAQAWAETQIALFLENLKARNKRRSQPREQN
ncbi:MAG: DUF3622 domain-containing protein [Pseudomonadota bacterium]|jgi:hypothetical protein|nr:DUF3622 domain-containing protein [Pseudomonadota bacterium]MDO7667553.1 DUF3622 domain-containing protein [Pseudomonadota bacterium]MDO7710848.1 DUF3622 domain-containing protein [Pseudomonadota bacterium]